MTHNYSISLAFAAGALCGITAGFTFEARYGDPVRITLHNNIPSAINPPAMLSLCSNGSSAQVNGILFVGSEEWDTLSRNRTLPPRCRNVPDGSGCIDWFEPGEDNWDAVLLHRPARKRRDPAWWEKAIASVEKGRQKP